jgi:hypothetical protein
MITDITSLILPGHNDPTPSIPHDGTQNVPQVRHYWNMPLTWLHIRRQSVVGPVRVVDPVGSWFAKGGYASSL